MEAEAHNSAMAHGLDGTLVEPDWPPLTFAGVRIVSVRLAAAGAR